MVAARFDFLSAGHYQPLADAVAELAAPALAGPRAAGPRCWTPEREPATTSGPCWTVSAPARSCSGARSGSDGGERRRTLLRADGVSAAAIGLDISKFALRRAARMNPEALNVVGDVWQPLPVADNAVDVVTVVFAPRNAPEFARVLRPGGRLVVVTPRPGHLAEIAGQTGMLGIEPAKDERLAASLGRHFAPVAARDLDLALALSPRDVANLAFMGPAGHHLDRAALAALEAALPPRTAVSARFRISVFAPHPLTIPVAMPRPAGRFRRLEPLPEWACSGRKSTRE